MTEIKTTDIPRRQKCVNKEHPYIGGSKDIIDDELQLTQAQINAIVLGDAVNVNINYSSAAIDVTEQGTGNTSVALTASISTPADSIKIKKNGTQIASGAGTSLSHTDTFNIADATAQYIAEFALGGLPKIATRNLGVVYYGSGTASTAAKKAVVKASPAGTYNINVAYNADYVYFIVPASMTISRATMGGFDFPLQAPTNVTVGSASFKCYQSSNTYDAGTITVVLT